MFAHYDRYSFMNQIDCNTIQALQLALGHSNSFLLATTANMISDEDLYRLAIFLGSAAVLLIVLYHFLEVNAVEEPEPKNTVQGQGDIKSESTLR